MLSRLFWEGTCYFPPSNTIRTLWWKYIFVYWGYWIETFWCIAIDRNKLIHKIMSTSCSVSLFYLIVTANKMLPELPHFYFFEWTVKREKLIDTIINYNVVKYWWLWWSIYMCLFTIRYVSYFTMLPSYNWYWYQCTWKWKLSGLWYQFRLQTIYISIIV